MDTNLVYMPAFRARQQEMIVLKSFDFGNKIYPLIEIVKEHDRKRDNGTQKEFQEIYTDLINGIKASKVFVDLPVYLKVTGSMQSEVVSFSLDVIDNLEKRCEYLNMLSGLNNKIIPVISSYLLKTGERDTIRSQYNLLRNNYTSLAFRITPAAFNTDFPIVCDIVSDADYIIIDIEQLSPYHNSPPLRPIVASLKSFNGCTKILLRSAINTEIQNVSLEHGQVVFDADNSQIDNDVLRLFGVNSCGDYAGIKKDDLSAGGTISPGFLYYDSTENQFYGFRASIKKLEEFANTIVPDVLASQSTRNMLQSTPPFLTDDNAGYQTLLRINNGTESGKSQAKFKKIAMEHYLFCIREKIRHNILNQQP